MSPDRESVLVLDGQTNQALACVRSLGRAGCDVRVAATRTRPLAAWSRFCQGRFKLGGETPAAFAALRTWAIAHHVTMVLPLTERSCVLCNLEREVWEQTGITVGCPPEAVLRQAFDKALTIEAARACGVSVPPTRMPTSMHDAHVAVQELGFPCVVKSRFSNAWNGTQFLADPGTGYVRDASELERAIIAHRQADNWPVLQAFVPGQGKGVFALFDRGRAVAWFAHERLRDVRPSGSGSSLRSSAALDPRLLGPAERLLTDLQWHGPAMVEFRDDGIHPPYLMEVNGRFWGSLQLAVSAGADFPQWWLSIVRGRTVERRTNYVTGVTVRWLWGDIKRFLYILAGAPAGYPGRYPSIGQGLRELFGRQPPGTHLEAWDPDDRWPAVGEWVQGIADLLSGRRRGSSTHGPARAGAVTAAALPDVSR
ncbi:MAG TPA: ATP-grasp domain-containing protein [Gemmatimonadales bacterium]|nr:ATP-grasp domain-containing protein [Gemmatimonadales bacterium]